MIDGQRSNVHAGSSINDFLEEEGVLDAFQTRAIEEVTAWQLAQAKDQKLRKRS